MSRKIKKSLTELPLEDFIRHTRKHAGRFAVPPYFAVFSLDDTLVANLPNIAYRTLAPGTEMLDARAMREKLLRIRQELRWSRETLALALGVSTPTLRRWETGERKPCGAARRLVWLIDHLTRHRGHITSMLDLMIRRYGEQALEVEMEGYLEPNREVERQKNAPLP